MADEAAVAVPMAEETLKSSPGQHIGMDDASKDESTLVEGDVQKRKVEEKTTQDPPATPAEPAPKRLRPTPPDPAAVRKQVEYYLSDMNLRYDKFFHEKISSHSEGWLEMDLIISCNKMKALHATKEDVTAALKDSPVEVREDGGALRRPGNMPLPALESRPQHPKKNSAHVHDGGVIATFRNIPEEQSWMQVKAQVKEKMPPKAHLWFVSEVSDRNQCSIAAAPFENDVQFFEDLVIELSGATVKCEICQGEELTQVLKLLPRHIKEKRDRESRKRQKEKNRPIMVGSQRFLNVAALRTRVREVLNSRSDGEQLKKDGSDFKLIKALLEFHPKGAEKSAQLVGIKVAKSIQGDNRCFYMIKEDGSEEDFSAVKCLNNVELNPPYVVIEAKKLPETSVTAGAPEESPTHAEGTEEASPAFMKEDDKETADAKEKVDLEEKEDSKQVEGEGKPNPVDGEKKPNPADGENKPAAAD